MNACISKYALTLYLFLNFCFFNKTHQSKGFFPHLKLNQGTLNDDHLGYLQRRFSSLQFKPWSMHSHPPYLTMGLSMVYCTIGPLLIKITTGLDLSNTLAAASKALRFVVSTFAI